MPPNDSPDKKPLVIERVETLMPQSFAASAKWTAQSETAEELVARLAKEKVETDSRLRREEADAQASRRNQFVTLCVGLGIVLIVFFTCASILLSGTYPTDVEKWATVTMSSILTGAAGFAWGKATAK